MPPRLDVRYQIVKNPDEHDEAEFRDDDLQLLSSAERARADRFVFPRDRAVFIAAHVLLRRMLTEHADAPADGWAFLESAFGKPSLDPRHGESDLAFNIAHTRGLVACAVGRVDGIGIDVEVIRPDIPALDIAERFFSASERADLAACPADTRAIRFTEIWTLKEAYVKAVGQGLSHALDTFSFGFDGGQLGFSPPADDTAPWHVALFAPTPGHRMAVAVSASAIDPIVARESGMGADAAVLTPVYTCAVQPGG